MSAESPAYDPPHHATTPTPQRLPRISSGIRVTVLGWSLWLLGSWVLSLSMMTVTPAVRTMVVATVIGAVIVWPIFRLSEASESSLPVAHRAFRRLAAVWLDWLAMTCVFQAVIWPLSWMRMWSVQHAMWVSLLIAAWSLLTGLFAAIGSCSQFALARVTATIGIMLLVLGAPTLAVIHVGGSWVDPLFSPLTAGWEIAGPNWQLLGDAIRPEIISVLLAAAFGWLIALVAVLRLHEHGATRDRA